MVSKTSAVSDAPQVSLSNKKGMSKVASGSMQYSQNEGHACQVTVGDLESQCTHRQRITWHRAIQGIYRALAENPYVSSKARTLCRVLVSQRQVLY